MGNTYARLEPQWLQTALAVGETGSPAAAGVRVGISTATAYRHIEALERALGREIFDKRRAGWRLREDAIGLVDLGRRMESLLRSAGDELRHAAARTRIPLRIAVSEDFAAHYVAPRLMAFCDRHADIAPELVVSNAFADLVRGEADVAIRPHKQPGNALIGRRAGRISHAFYASAGYLDRCAGRPLDVRAHPLCGFTDLLRHFSAAHWMAENMPAKRIVARFGSTTALLRAVESGLGVGLLPCYVADASPELQRIASADSGIPVDIWLVTAAANRKRPAVQAFMRHFAAAIRSDGPMFAGRPA